MNGVQCTGTNARGLPCRAAAVHGSDPPRCFAHSGLGKMGRPTLLTEERAEQLVAMLRVGNYLHVAIRAAGIARQTFDGWMTRGLSGLEADEPYRRLRDRVEQARAEGQARHVALVARAATDDWRAAAWLLERQYPAMWGAVSVRVRAEEPEPQELPTAASDPFAEVDELAERRRGR